jgi:sister-chromatid-cohesion protein PDS5
LHKTRLATAKTTLQDEVPDMVEWIDNVSISPFLLAKIQALKCLRWRIMSLSLSAQKETDMTDLLSIAKPLFKLLRALIANQGSLSEADAQQDDPRVKTRMRLQAVTSLLHLHTIHEYEERLLDLFMPLVLFMQVQSVTYNEIKTY